MFWWQMLIYPVLFLSHTKPKGEQCTAPPLGSNDTKGVKRGIGKRQSPELHQGHAESGSSEIGLGLGLARVRVGQIEGRVWTEQGAAGNWLDRSHKGGGVEQCCARAGQGWI